MRILMAAAIVFVTGGAVSADYTVKGSVTCSGILNEDSHEHYREYNKWWLLGYFTARNYIDQSSAGLGIEDDNIYSMAIAFCRSNPDKDWDDAAIHTYDLLN